MLLSSTCTKKKPSQRHRFKKQLQSTTAVQTSKELTGNFQLYAIKTIQRAGYITEAICDMTLVRSTKVTILCSSGFPEAKIFHLVKILPSPYVQQECHKKGSFNKVSKLYGCSCLATLVFLLPNLFASSGKRLNEPVHAI